MDSSRVYTVTCINEDAIFLFYFICFDVILYFLQAIDWSPSLLLSTSYAIDNHKVFVHVCKQFLFSHCL